MYSIHSLPYLLRARRVLIRFAVLLVALTPGLTFAATIRVPTDHPTIQGAIIAASSGDSILVGAGTYFENLDLLGKNLVLRGTSSAQSTIIDGQQVGRVVKMTGGGILEGLTLQNGRSNFTGGGVQVEGSAPAILQDLVIRNNSVGVVDIGRGGGVFLSETTAGVIVRRCSIEDNYAGDSGGGIWEGGNVLPGNNLIIQCVIARNGCHVAGGGLRLSTGSAIENLVLRNWSDSFAGGISGGGWEIKNNTVVANFNNNSVLFGAGIRVTTQLSLIENNLVALNHGLPSASAGAGIQAAGPIGCNNSWGNDGPDYIVPDASGNFSLDPLFCDPLTDDFSISDSSPCAPGASNCGLIGGLLPACGVTPIQRVTWGNLKARYME